MRNNDLSAVPVPKLLLVFEGALAWVPPDDRNAQRDYQRAMKRKRWDEAADLFEFNPKMELVIWDRSYRMSMQIEVITYLGPPEFAAEVSRRVRDEEELPVHAVWATTPQKLGRQLSYMRDIAKVYDPWPDNQMMFGARGKLLTDPNQFGY